MEDEFGEYDMNIELTDYCIVVLGKTEGVKDEISKVSQTPPKYMDAKGLVISVFKSAMNTNELNVYFKINHRSFLLFELGDGNFGVHLNEKFNKFLFGGLIPDNNNEEEDDISRDVLDTLKNNMLKEGIIERSDDLNSWKKEHNDFINNTISGVTKDKKITLESSTEEFSKMTGEQQKKEIDVILDKISGGGVKALSELELEILKKFN